MHKFKNPIKWSGSKSCYVTEIISHISRSMNGFFYEPFCGSCSVTFEILYNPAYEDLRKRIYGYRCSDINKDLIDLWNIIKDDPYKIADSYEQEWFFFNGPGQSFKTEDIQILYQKRKRYFKFIKDQFNTKLPYFDQSIYSCYFLFLLRTCFNGLVRYNQSGQYNSSCHFSRPGIEPKKMRKMILDTSTILNTNDITFEHTSYNLVIPQSEYDFVFMDPPYSNSSEMYHGSIDQNELIEYCNNLRCNYALTFNGDREVYTGTRLDNLKYAKEILLHGKNSSFSRLKNKNVKVHEILYVTEK